MITLYDPKTRVFRAYNEADIQDPLLLQLNILIETRAQSLILLDAHRGVVTNPVEQYRVDVVQDGKNPST